MIQLLEKYRQGADGVNPYVLIPTDRLNHILQRRSKGNWDADFEIINNLIRSLEVLCRRAKVEAFTLHDLRLSCITNWAKVMPIHEVQYLAGHSNINTTRKYYLSIQATKLTQAREIQSQLISSLTNF